MIRLWLRRLTGVERDEVLPVLLMGAYGVLGMTSYYLLKPVRNAVFVERVGAENLPYVYILTALVVSVVVLVYSRYVDRIGERRLLLGTFGLLAGSLVFFWWLLSRDTSFWSSGAFYIWGKLYGLLLVSQFWLVGNLVFTTRQGRRVFAVVGLGLIVGGIVGSAVVGVLAPVVGSENLLLLGAVPVALCALVCAALFPRMEAGAGAGARLMDEISGDALRILVRSSHLRAIAGILGLTILVSTLVDWQLNRAVELAIPTEDGMARFWGFFMTGVNVVSVSIQALVTGFVLRRWGVGVAVLVLPVALLVATVGVIVAPVLLMAALAKGTEGALRYSLDQSTREVLYLPVAAETKYKVKPLIDLAVYRAGTGVGGIVLLVAIQGLGFGIRQVAVLAAGLTLLWIAVALRARREYVASLAHSIRGRFAHLDPAAAPLAEAGVLQTVSEALKERDPVRCAFVLDLLDRGGSPAIEAVEEDLVAILDHPEPRVRARAVEVLGRASGSTAAEAVRSRLGDPDPDVRESAVRALSRLGDQPPDRLLRDLVSSPDVGVRIAALRCLVEDRLSVDASVVVGISYLEERWSPTAPADQGARLELALAAGTLRDDERAVRYLDPLLADEDAGVASAAVRSAGRVARPELLRRVVAALGRRETRAAAQDALVAAGEEGVRALEPLLLDHDADPAVRRRAPDILSHIPLQASVDALRHVAEGGCRDAVVERRSLKALSRLVSRDDAELRLAPEVARMAAKRQLEATEAYGVVARNLRDAVGPRIRSDVRPAAPVVPLGEGLEMLIDAVHEAWEWRREALFHCLSILHPSEEIHRVHRLLAAGDGERLSNALEWLEHTVPRDLFELLAPVLREEEAGPPGASKLPRPELDALLYGLWHDDASSVASMAVWSSARMSPPGIERRLRIFREDASDPSVRSLAACLSERLESGPAVDSRELDPVERAALLKGAELFRAVGPSHLLVLAGAVVEAAVDEGTVVQRRGEPDGALRVVERGRVDLELADGGRTTVGDGGAFGTSCVLDGGPSPVGARSAEPCRLLELRHDDLRDLLLADGELAAAVLEGMGRRIGTFPD